MMLMKHAQKRSNLIPNRAMLAIYAPSQVAYITTEVPKDNNANIPDKFREIEQTAFQERVSQKAKDIMAAERLAALQHQRDYIDDENHWWNKLQTMTEPELKLMPLSFIRKYGSYLTNLKRYDKEFHMEENKRINGYYEQIKTLKKLQTDEEKSLMLKEFKYAFVPDIVTMNDLERTRGDYMKRQPRINPKELSYNFEQYSRYSRMISRASRVDDEKSTNFYKMVKYVKKNIDNTSDSVVYDFTVRKGFMPDLIEIPEEFEDVPIADVKPKDFARRSSNKKFIRTRTNKDMTNYDAWRCHDRQAVVVDHKSPNVAKFWIAPADLKKLFGVPDPPSLGIMGTGEYNFEDSNLDCFRLFDFKQTDMFHGLNREDEFYTGPKNMRKPLHKRKRKWPSVEQFWAQTEPAQFKLAADEYADVRKFKRWFRAQLKRADTMEKSFEEEIMAKYGKKIDICLGDWNEKGVINRDMACHKLDCTQFMTEGEIKEYPHGPVTLTVAPTMFDLSKAKRVKITKEDLELKEQEEEARKQAAL